MVQIEAQRRAKAKFYAKWKESKEYKAHMAQKKLRLLPEEKKTHNEEFQRT
jgi:hypothetical protein